MPEPFTTLPLSGGLELLTLELLALELEPWPPEPETCTVELEIWIVPLLVLTPVLPVPSLAL